MSDSMLYDVAAASSLMLLNLKQAALQNTDTEKVRRRMREGVLGHSYINYHNTIQLK